MEIHCRASGFPFAESLITRNPEVFGVVERQSGSSRKRNAVIVAKTAQIPVSYTTERTSFIFDARSHDPNVSTVILNDAPNTICQILVCGEYRALPASQPFFGSDPQTAIACAQKIKDLVAG